MKTITICTFYSTPENASLLHQAVQTCLGECFSADYADHGGMGFINYCGPRVTKGDVQEAIGWVKGFLRGLEVGRS